MMTCQVLKQFKGTQEWELFWLRLGMLYYFMVSYEY
jgi:hypothetical protein